MTDSLISKRLNGIGEYYFSQKLRQIDELRKRGKNILNLGIGSPDLKPPKEVEEALISEMSENGYHQYQNYKGLPELRLAFAKWYERYFQVSLNPEKEILPLMGSKEGIMHSCMALLDKGDEVLVPNPGYPSYASASKLAGGIVKYYELVQSNNYLPDFSDLETRDLSRIKLMWINYPHMPTGTNGSEKLFKQLLDFSRKHQIIIINDNPYGFILTKQRNSILKNRHPEDLILELNSLSKSHNMAGWRVGMIGGNSSLIEAVLTFKSNMDSGHFRPVMRAAVKALEMGEYWFQKLNSIYLERREKVFEAAHLLGCTFDQGQVGMFVWSKVPKEIGDGKIFTDQLLDKHRLFVTPGSVFGPAGKSYIRFSLCNDLSVWNEVLNRIKK